MTQVCHKNTVFKRKDVICRDAWEIVSSNVNDANINKYSADAQTGRPDSPNTILRDGIALHKGGSVLSTGCLTFNMKYNKGCYQDFIDAIYPKRKSNIAYLNFLCLDERNAVRINDDTITYTGEDTYENLPDTGCGKKNCEPTTLKKNDRIDFKRYYDLVKPKNTIPKVTTTVKPKKETKIKTK